MAPAVAQLNEEMLCEPSPQELADEMASLDNRVAESWGFLRRNSPLESPEVQELQVRVGLFEEALKKLERRLAGRKRRGRDFISEEEKQGRGETEGGLPDLVRTPSSLPPVGASSGNG